MRIISLEPTVFFVRDGGALRQLACLRVDCGERIGQATLSVRAKGLDETVSLSVIDAGLTEHEVYLPDLREPAQLKLGLWIDGALQNQINVDWQPQRHWEVYLVHGSHHDLGYTDLPSNLLREHDSFLDDVVRWCEETADWPEESRFRYVVEQGWSVLHFIEHRPPEVVERLARLMQEGRIEVTALLGNETSELCGPEEQIRLLYPAFRLKRRFGIPIRSAELNDVPGLSWGLVSVLAGSGIRYFAPGIPDYFSWGYKVHCFWDEEAVLPRDLPGAFWWQGPDESRVLFWYGHHVDLWTYEQATKDLAQRLAQLAQRGYPFDLVRFRVQGGHRDNSPPDVRLSLIAREWNSRWAYPRLVVATNTRFFQHLERDYGSQLRVLRGDLPNTDYTVGATSTAKETSINRLAHDTLLSAEKLAACASLVSDYEYPAGTLAEAYDCTLLYDEHTWGMAHPIGPAQDACWSQKGEFAYRAAALAHDVLSKSTNRIADRLGLGTDGYHLVIFNPLARERTDVARVPAVEPAPCGRPMHWSYASPGVGQPPMLVLGTAIGRNLVDLPVSLLETPFELIDLSTGESVPYQVVTLDDPLAARPFAAQRYALSGPDQLGIRALIMDPAHLKELVFVAENVPPLGFKTYRIVPAARQPSFASSIQVGPCSLENRFYRITLDPESGAITSIFDKGLQREWVDGAAPHGFNQLVARSPKTGNVSLPAHSVITEGERGPIAGSLIVKGDGLGCPQRTQEITLYDSIKRIDLANRLLRDATPHLELYFAFPFAAEKPQFRYEASNSVIEPIRDQLPGSNTDAYAMQHWLAMWDSNGGIVWSSLEAPVMAVGGLWPGYVSQGHHGLTPPGYGHDFIRDPSQLAKGHVYSYAMINNFRTNFQPVQVADVLFRYSLGSYSGDWKQGGACDLGWSVAVPLHPVCITGPQEGPLPKSASFCRLDAPNVRLLTIKAAEDGDGLILRLAETEGRDTRVLVTLPFLEIGQALLTNLVEEDDRVLQHDRHSVHVSLRGHGTATVRCSSSRRWPQAETPACRSGPHL